MLFRATGSAAFLERTAPPPERRPDGRKEIPWRRSPHGWEVVLMTDRAGGSEGRSALRGKPVAAGEPVPPLPHGESVAAGEAVRPGESAAPVESVPAAAPVLPGKYARVERERRFLLAEPPAPSAVAATRVITDRYLTGTRLRLRRVESPGGARELKLTQKVPLGRPGAVQGLITNTYLSAAEYDLLASLPAAVLSKTRLSVPPLGVDVFAGPLRGLVLAEAEFATDEEARAFVPPPVCVSEVTDDARFTGGRLVATSPEALGDLLAEFGLGPAGVPGPR
jgi:CYTH domain-containing protein